MKRRNDTSSPFSCQSISALVRRVHGDSLVRNSVYTMATTVATSLLGYLYWAIATRTSSAHDVGLAAALVSAMTIAANLSNLGVGTTLVQRLPRRASGHAWSLMLNTGLAIGTLAGLLTGAAVVVLLPLFSNQFAAVANNPVFVVVFITGVALSTTATLVDYTFVAERATGNVLVRNVAFGVLKIVLLAYLLVHAGSLGIFASWALAVVIALLSGLILVRRLGRGYRPTARGTASQARSMLSSMVGHHAINIGGVAPIYLMPLFVTARLSPAENAYYYTTWMLGGVFFMVSPAVASSLLAEGSHAPEALWRKAQRAVLMIGALLGPATAVFLLGGHYILAVFGRTYAQHGLLLLTLLVLSAAPDAITNVYVSILRVQQRLRHAAALNLGMAALTLALAWVLLPVLGIAGAGWAWLIAQTAGSLVVGVDAAASRNRKPTDARSAVQDEARGEVKNVA
jgi:O-antigen/teichoic acid export membrane protein